MRRGITLVELLIVMSLTLLLLGLLGPALAQSRHAARTVECMNNLRQIGLLHMDPMHAGERWGWSAYDLSNSMPVEHRFPSSNVSPLRADGNPGSLHNEIINIEWLENLAPDMPAYWTLVCPVATDLGVNSYGMNFRVVHQLHAAYSTSRDIIFGDSRFKIVDVAREFDFRHNNRSTLYFGDHHVQEVTWAVFSDEQWAQQSQRGREIDP